MRLIRMIESALTRLYGIYLERWPTYKWLLCLHQHQRYSESMSHKQRWLVRNWFTEKMAINRGGYRYFWGGELIINNRVWSVWKFLGHPIIWPRPQNGCKWAQTAAVWPVFNIFIPRACAQGVKQSVLSVCRRRCRRRRRCRHRHHHHRHHKNRQIWRYRCLSDS